MKKSKSIISVLLAVCMTISMMPAMAFAGTTENKLSYVALGDSMSQGYMFTDYNEDANAGHNCGWQGSSERSSIKLFYNYLKTKNSGANVELTDLSIQGFQPDELWALFRQYGEEGYSIGDDSSLTEGAKMHFGWWVGGGRPFDSYEKMAKKYTEAIINADVLTYDIGENYFGTYIGDRAGIDPTTGKLFQKEGGEHFTEMLDCLSVEEQEQVEALRKKMMDALDEEKPGLSETVDGLLYAYVSYIYYTDKCIDKIYELNPDIDLIICGLFNPHPELSVKLDNGLTIDYSGLLDMMMESLNIYTSVLNKHSAEYKFADMSQNTPVSFADELYYYEDLSDDAKYMLAAMIFDPEAHIVEAVDCEFWDALIDNGVSIMEYLPFTDERISIVGDEQNFGFDTVDELKGFLEYCGFEVDDNYTMKISDQIMFMLGGQGAFDWNITGSMMPGGDSTYAVAATISSWNEYPFKVPKIINDYWNELMEKNGYTDGCGKEKAIEATGKTVDEFAELFGSRWASSWYLVNNVDKDSDFFKEKVLPEAEKYYDICRKAMTYREFPMEEFSGLRSGNLNDVDGAIQRLKNNSGDIKDSDYRLLHWLIRHGSAARGFGAHPCPRGQQAKYENIVAAYETKLSAKEQFISNTIQFINSEKFGQAMEKIEELVAEAANNPEVQDLIKEYYPQILNAIEEKYKEVKNNPEAKAKLDQLKEYVTQELGKYIETIPSEEREAIVKAVADQVYNLIKKYGTGFMDSLLEYAVDMEMMDKKTAKAISLILKQMENMDEENFDEAIDNSLKIAKIIDESSKTFEKFLTNKNELKKFVDEYKNNPEFKEETISKASNAIVETFRSVTKAIGSWIKTAAKKLVLKFIDAFKLRLGF